MPKELIPRLDSYIHREEGRLVEKFDFYFDRDCAAHK